MGIYINGDSLIGGSNEYQTLLEQLYPVGAIYLGIQDTCPLQTLGIGTWQLITSGKALWSSDGSNAGSTIEAGLPNITATLPADDYNTYGWAGAFYEGSTVNPRTRHLESMDGQYHPVYFDASRSNAIYGKSNTVQPPAYVVNIWRRVS